MTLHFPGVGDGERDRLAWLLVDRFGLNELRLRADRLGGAITIAEQAKDALSEMSGEQQMRMQQYTDRMAKAGATLANIMRKMSDVSGTIIGNMK